ncbi:MAG: class I SAM-dependent methyltransferase [Acidimicrobiales bacterium]
MARSVSDQVAPVVRSLLGSDPSIAVRFWDGSVMGPERASSGTVIDVRSPMALRRMLWSPGELGIARAYVAGDVDISGDVYRVLDLRSLLGDHDRGVSLGFTPRGVATLARAAASVRALGPPPVPPKEESRLRGRRHSRRRDAIAVRHHYDVSNDFYRLVLGPSLTYSCGYWDDGVSTLEEAQAAKYEHISRKLNLEPGKRLLDVGCGWGGMVLHAASHHGVSAVGITISPSQHALAVARVEAAGLSDRVEIRLQDYRELAGEQFDAISSIGMFEHVGDARLAEYASILLSLLKPTGRLLNHGISRPAGPPPLKDRSFINRYVFPDGELHEAGRVVTVLQETGFEVRDLESLREHYARTLRSWVANLESDWDRAVELTSAARARIWRLYMAGSAVNFEEGRTMIHQILAVRPGPAGVSAMAATRRGWYYGGGGNNGNSPGGEVGAVVGGGVNS